MKFGKKLLLSLFLLLPVTVVLTSTAIAIPLVGDLAIDFRTDDWQGSDSAHNQHSYTVDGVTAIANPGLLFANDSADGLGVQGGEYDEINYGERLEIYFTGGAYLSGIWITDLFDSPDGVDGEEGLVTLSTDLGGVAINFYGNLADQANGEYYIDFGTLFYTSSAIFEPIGETFNNEFSVAGFTGAPVPEPATLLLLGTGLVGFAGFSRKKLLRK